MSVDPDLLGEGSSECTSNRPEPRRGRQPTGGGKERCTQSVVLSSEGRVSPTTFSFGWTENIGLEFSLRGSTESGKNDDTVLWTLTQYILLVFK